MLKPRLIFEESSKYPGEIAVMASFVPTFEPVQPQEEGEVVEDEEPESTVLTKSEDF